MTIADDDLRRVKDATDIGAVARGNGMRTLRQDGMAKVRAGLTTIDEVLRVVA